MSTSIIYIASDNILWIGDPDTNTGGLLNYVTGLPINDLSPPPSVTLVDADDVEVAGQTWPKAMTYVVDSDGIYRATLEDALVLAAGQEYTAKITADGGPGLKGYWEHPVRALVRH